MNLYIKLLVLFLVSNSSIAALPPEYQNEKDLKVIISFIKSHPAVISTLKSIDFSKKIVYFEKDCHAIFVRKHVSKAQGWVGPADPLEYKNSNCQIDYSE